MSWLEKIKRLRGLSSTDDDIYKFFDVTEPAPSGFIERLRNRSVSAAYLEFLRVSDGAQFGTIVIAGSGSRRFTGVPILEKRWRPELKGKGIPIGEDAGGAPFVLSSNGGVDRLDVGAPEPVFRRIAADFDEFLERVLLGGSYDRVFLPGAPPPDDPWLRILRNQGWT